MHTLLTQFQPKPLYALSLLLFFMTLFDGMLAFTVPILIVESGFSNTMMGILVGSSSLFGGIFDFILARYVRHTHFRRLYLGMFVCAFLFLFFLSNANSLYLFIAAMAAWGMYYDFMSFGSFDFVARIVSRSSHATSFGIMDVLKSSGYLLAPVIAGIFITDVISPAIFVFATIFLTAAYLFYFVLLWSVSKVHDPVETTSSKPFSFKRLVRQWRKIEQHIYPVIIAMFFINMTDAVFWTIGPILSEQMQSLHPFGGLLLLLYSFPALVTGWFVGSVSHRFGKKRTAFASLFIGSFIISFLWLSSSSLYILANIFAASFFYSLSWPTIRGSFADYMSESPHVSNSIAGVGDFSANIGYIVGPIAAGILADFAGSIYTFAVLGLAGMVVAFLLYPTSGRDLRIPKRI